MLLVRSIYSIKRFLKGVANNKLDAIKVSFFSKPFSMLPAFAENLNDSWGSAERNKK
jgi:hypothetical protein